MTPSGLATQVSERGRRRTLRAIQISPRASVISRGTLIRIAEVHDEFWLSRDELPDAEQAISMLKRAPRPPDIFAFSQKIPDTAPVHCYHMEWTNVAVARFDSYGEWFEKQVNRSVRKNIRKAEREGVVAEVVPYTDELVAGICEVYNELSVRQGRTFWHYGKAFETVKAENGTYLDRSFFVAARCNGELIGFLKCVVDRDIASIMQILSKAAHFERRPANALLARAVRECEARGIHYLTYGEYIYGKKTDSSLIDFKRNNGFFRCDVPRYFVPITARGKVALTLGLHRSLHDRLPARAMSLWLVVRTGWHRMSAHFKHRLRK
jgi:hypothetical protein